MNWRKALFGFDKDEDTDEDIDDEQIDPIKHEKNILYHHGETVKDVIVTINETKKAPVEEIIENIHRAREEEKIILIDPHPPSNILSYTMSHYTLWFWATVGFTALLYASINLIPQIYPYIALRNIVGVIFILYIPGYTLIEALYPKARELERLERFALNIGLSIAIVPLIGLVLNSTPGGISLNPILTSLSVTVILLGIVAIWRKYTLFKLTLKKRKETKTSQKPSTQADA